MDRMIYVVGNEQEQHFEILFEIFEALGWSFADQCYHLSYWYISLPDGKMKSREGNVVDADTLYSTVTQEALRNVQGRYPDLDSTSATHRAQRIAMAAIKFFIVKYDAMKDFVFDREDSLRFDWETWPYVLYTYARARSILRTFEDSYERSEWVSINSDHLAWDDGAHQLLVTLNQFSETVARAAHLYQPYLVARYCIDLASAFNSRYHTTTILDETNTDPTSSRVALAQTVSDTLARWLWLLGIETVEVM